MDAIVVGIDVSTDRLDVCVQPGGQAQAFDRDAAGVEALVATLTPLAPQRVVLEATGGFETVVTASLAAAGLPVVVVNPAQVRAFARAIGQRAKTDPIDAAVIACFAAATRPEGRALPSAETQRLADLVARRRQIIAMMVAERQRDKRASGRMKKSIARLLKALQAELAEIDRDIDEAVRGSPAWRELGARRRTCSPPCRASARPSPARGWPTCRNSARSTAARSRRSPAAPRGRAGPGSGAAAALSAQAAPACAAPCSWALLGALAAARWNPVLRGFHQRLIAIGKPKRVAAIAVARKLLTILNAILRDNTPWQPT